MDSRQVLQEVQFKAVRSSGAGGQHVNKVSTKVILLFSVKDSMAFTDEEKERLLQALSSRFTKDNLLIIRSGETRSQHRNREIAEDRLLTILKNALVAPKERKATQPSKKSVEKRLKSKRKISEKKTSRKKPDLE